jgi:hypothetical protein
LEAGVTLTAAERSSIRRYFVICLCNLQEFEMYWIPEARRVSARSVSVEKRHWLPESAALIGRYSNSVDAVVDRLDPIEFLRDLEDVIARKKPPSVPGALALA